MRERKAGIISVLTGAKKPATAPCLSREGGVGELYSRIEGRPQEYTRIGYRGGVAGGFSRGRTVSVIGWESQRQYLTFCWLVLGWKLSVTDKILPF